MNLVTRLAAADRARLFWRFQFIGWGGTLFISIGMGGFIYWPSSDAMVLGFVRSVFGLVATSFVLRPFLARIRKGRPAFSWLSLVAIFLLCGFLGLTDTAVVAGLGHFLHADWEHAGLRQFLSVSILVRWVLYACWSFLYFSIHFWLDTQQNQLRMAQTEAAIRASELQVLRAQVNPHFLFNSLNSILAESDHPDSVRRITLALADYLRFSLKQRADMELLSVELTALESYLRVEKIRFENDLEYFIEADRLSSQTCVPVALIQPLLENAIKFGQRSSIRPLRVSITSEIHNETVIITVTNSGEWCEPGSDSSTGTGLANLQRRLQLLYDDLAVLRVEAKDHFVVATVKLPILNEKAS